MVRFQDPSEEDNVSDRDTWAESLFPEYALKEWTSSTFEELFSAEDWQDITGEKMSCRYSEKHPALHITVWIYIQFLLASVCLLLNAPFRMCLLASRLPAVAPCKSFCFVLFFSGGSEDRLLRKKVLKSEAPDAARPSWGQEVTVKMQCVLEDRTVVEKDSKLVFVIGEGDVSQVNHWQTTVMVTDYQSRQKEKKIDTLFNQFILIFIATILLIWLC